MGISMDYEKFKKDYGDFLDSDDAIKSFKGSSHLIESCVAP